MSEGNKKSGGSYRPQSAVTIGRNKRLKGERHAKRMAAQAEKHLKVARGYERDVRREPLQLNYAKRRASLAGQPGA